MKSLDIRHWLEKTMPQMQSIAIRFPDVYFLLIVESKFD
jgi:hypothetical protein